MTTLRFTVLGRPQPAGSKRAFAIIRDGKPTGRVAVVDANQHAKSWQQEVRSIATAAMRSEHNDDTYRLLADALNVSMTFYSARPRSHYRSGRFSDQLKDSAPPFPTGRPDALKLARGTEDALTGVVWVDDAQVVDLDAHKRYGAPERCEIIVHFTPHPSSQRPAPRTP